jgi:holo-[acyl-carrier protein] synthase
MIVGVGVDVVDITRFAAILLRTPAVRGRVFTAREAESPAHTLAGRFAAKEALAKALGAPESLQWHDAEVTSGADGRPHLRLSGTIAACAQELGVVASHLSIAHDAGIATAFVVLEGAPHA